MRRGALGSRLHDGHVAASTVAPQKGQGRTKVGADDDVTGRYAVSCFVVSAASIAWQCSRFVFMPMR